eukprot:365718-Chlamydomonas_euryale.AAC.9
MTGQSTGCPGCNPLGRRPATCDRQPFALNLEVRDKGTRAAGENVLCAWLARRVTGWSRSRELQLKQQDRTPYLCRRRQSRTNRRMRKQVAPTMKNARRARPRAFADVERRKRSDMTHSESIPGWAQVPEQVFLLLQAKAKEKRETSREGGHADHHGWLLQSVPTGSAGPRGSLRSAGNGGPSGLRKVAKRGPRGAAQGRKMLPDQDL